jgi:hypothetical protein
MWQANEANLHHTSFGRTSGITNIRMPPLQICGHCRARPKSNAVLSTRRPHPITLHFAHYNLVRVHKTLRVTPAMAANVTDRLSHRMTSLINGSRCGMLALRAFNSLLFMVRPCRVWHPAHDIHSTCVYRKPHPATISILADKIRCSCARILLSLSVVCLAGYALKMRSELADGRTAIEAIQ